MHVVPKESEYENPAQPMGLCSAHILTNTISATGQAAYMKAMVGFLFVCVSINGPFGLFFFLSIAYTLTHIAQLENAKEK